MTKLVCIACALFATDSCFICWMGLLSTKQEADQKMDIAERYKRIARVNPPTVLRAYIGRIKLRTALGI